MSPYLVTAPAAVPSGSPPVEALTVAGRLDALDVLRGIAICGILLMNIWKMGGVSALPLTRFPARLDAEWVTWGIQTLVVDGAMRGLFTLLFGASMLLMLRHADRGGAERTNGSPGPIDAWARRSLGLMAIGLFQWLVLQWPGEILWDYGIAGLFLLAFRAASVRTLLASAGLIIAALSLNATYRSWQEVDQLQQARPALAALAAGRPIDADARAAIAAAAAEREVVRPSAGERAERIAERTRWRSRFGWSERFWLGENIGLSGWLSVAQSVSFMLIGMAMLRTGVLSGQAPAATYRRLMVVGYGGGLALRAILLVLAVRTGWDMTSPVAGTTAWTIAYAVAEPARLLVTLGHVGLIVTVWRGGGFGAATTLRAIGRMTLTLYCFQSLATSTLFYGFGLVGRWGLPTLWAVAAAIWLASAVLARAWLARFPLGPMERALRWVAWGGRPAASRPRFGTA